MSKELEALRNFISECENDWKNQPKRRVNGAINSNVSKYMDSLKSILTPPTAEEVCMALSEYFGEEVIFLVNDKEFVIKCNIGYKYIVETDDVLYYIKVGLPLYLITLIGKFYEGEMSKITHEEALDILKNRITTLSLNHKIGSRDIAKQEVKEIVKCIETHVIPVFEQALNELERLKKFKETFDNYELAKKQDFIAYENWVECEAELKVLKELENDKKIKN